MASIRERKRDDGSTSYEVRIRREGFPRISGTFDTKNMAKDWAAVIESEMARGIFIDRTEAEKNTLGDLMKRYLRDVSPQKKGRQSERYRIEAFLREDLLCKYKVAGLSGKVLAEWRDQRLKVVSGSTCNRDLNLISHVINVARKEWGIHIENPVSMIRRPPENRARSRRLSPDEEARLMVELTLTERAENGTYTAGGTHNPWIQPLVTLALETAMRRSELLSLRWNNVFLADRFVRLLDTKNGDARDVPLSSWAYAILNGLPRDIGGQVFPISADAVKKSFTRACTRAGIKDLHFHDLRHEATSRIAEKLENVLELSAVTGHKTLAMLKRYYHPRAKDLARKLG
jgi:integrase